MPPRKPSTPTPIGVPDYALDMPTQAASRAHAPCSTIFKKHYRTPCTDAKREEMLAAGKGAYMCTKCGGTRLWGHHKPSTALDPKGRSMPNMYQCSCCREWLDPDELTPGGLTAREHKEMDDKKID